jgi:lipoprotein-releasing system permease protein
MGKDISKTNQTPLPQERGRRGAFSFPFFIARRYLFSKKSTNAINVISGISVIGVAVATMAMVVTLSVFNGFSDLVASLFTAFDPQIEISPREGKTAPADDPILTEIRQLPEVAVATETVEDMALAVYHDRQAMVTIKGVEDNFDQLTHIREILYGDGTFELHAADLQYGILGIRLAEILGTGYRFDGPLQIYAPRREGQVDLTDPADGFVEDELYSPGMLFQVMQTKYDKNYILTSVGFARRIFDQQGMVSTLELRLKPGSDFDAVKEKIEKIAGGHYYVKDRYEQQDDTFRIMKIEKLIAYIFLTFILMVACFNIIGSLSMLIIDKKEDVVTLRNLGASDRQITQVFLFEGRMISAMGAVVGILIGLLLCWVQQTFGIIALGSSAGSFIVNAYPVSVHPLDVVLVFVTVIAVGFLSVWYPVRYFSRRLLN